MAIRVRKLARELKRSPWDILGICHAIGYTRYRSPEDMLPDHTVDKVRSAIRGGVEPATVPGREEGDPAPAPRPAPSKAPPPRDLMSSLVPGVVRQRSRPTATEEQRARTTEQLESQRVAVAAERAEVQSGREALVEERAALEAERGDLTALREELESLRLELAARGEELQAREQLAATPRTTDVPLGEILAERGLLGADEQERALGALASRRLLRELLGELRADREPALAVLRRRLVLVTGEAPELASGLVAVAVAPERAELPDASELVRQITRLGELLMLHGLRRVVVVGGRPAWQRLIHGGLDPRLEVRFSPGTPRGRAAAEADVTRTDAVLIWDVEVLPEGREVYATGRAVVVEVGGSGILDLVEGVRQTLES